MIGLLPHRRKHHHAGPLDPHFANVSLLLHMNGADGATSFADHSSYAHTVTASGNAQIDTADSMFDGASALFDGVSDYLSIPTHASLTGISGEFTLEFWMKSSNWTVDTTNRRVFSLKSNTNADGLEVNLNSFNVSKLIVTNNSTNILQSTSNLSGSWHHVAITRNASNRLDLWIDGVSEANTTASTTFNAAANIRIGTWEGTPGQGDYHGWLDELRLTKGVCRYTGTFTPAAAAFPNA